MGSYQEAEVYDSVDFFILNEITPIIGPHNIDLCRDNGLGVLKQYSGKNMERIKKRIIEIISLIGF